MTDLEDLSSDAITAAARGNARPAAAPAAPAANLPAPLRNNNPGALMPGGRLASYKTPEEGLAALDSNLQSYGKRGISTLRGVVQTWAPPNENDTAAYIAHMAKATGLDPDQKIDLSNPYVRHQLSAGIVQHENGTKPIYAMNNAAAPQRAAADDLPDFSSDAIVKAAQRHTTDNPTAAAPRTIAALAPEAKEGISNVGPALRNIAANQLTGIGSTIVGGYRGLATLVTGGGLENAANDVRDYQERHTYTPPTGTVGGDAVANFSSSGNPMNWPMIGLNKLGEKTAEVTGSPAAGAALNAGGNAALMLLGLRGKPATAPVEVGPTRPATGVYRPVMEAKPPALESPAEPVTVQPSAPNPAAPQPVRATAPNASTTAPSAAANAARSGTAAAADSQAAQAKAAPRPTDPEYFREVEPADTVAPTSEQQRRAQVLRSVGIEDARRSSLQGDKLSGSTDLQISKVDNPAGRYMQSVLDREKQALADHAENLAQKTGGLLDDGPKDQISLYQRGKTIVAPLKQLEDHYDQQATALYREADQRSQGVPTTLEQFRSVLGDDANMTNADRIHLRDAVNAYARKLNMMDDKGQVFSNGQQAETMRKYLTDNWTPQNGRFVSALKDALDQDVMGAAGEDVYAKARQMWAERKNTLDNPNGIAKLLNEAGPNGVNRSVPFEQISPTIGRMPVDQLAHVVETLKNVPEPIQPSAQAALSEIKAHFANEVRHVGGKHAGQWNAKGVTDYLRANAGRMNLVFTPEELAEFRNLSEAGQIVAKDQSYPGAAVQGHNLVRAGVGAAVTHGATAVGGATGSLFGPGGAAAGAAAGRIVGERASQAISDKASLKQAQKRTVKLSDLLKEGANQ